VNDPRKGLEQTFSETFSYGKLGSLLALAGAESLAAAAESKNRASSSLSRDIKDLESFFGCKLRQNDGRLAQLSAQGIELVHLLRRHLHELKEFRDKHTNGLHEVSFATGDSLLHLIVLPKLQALQKEFSRTIVNVAALRTFEIIQGLQNFSLDLGLLRLDSIPRKHAPAGKKRGLDYEEVGDYRYAVFIPSTLWREEMTEDEIFRLPYAMIKSHWDIDFLDWARESGTELGNIRIWCENFTQVFRLVRLGHYAGILPIFCSQLLHGFAELHEPAFLRDKKHKMALAWNSALIQVRGTMLPFINRAAEEMREGFYFSTG